MKMIMMNNSFINLLNEKYGNNNHTKDYIDEEYIMDRI